MDRVNTEGQHTEQREKCKQQSWMGNILTWSVSVFSVSLSIELSPFNASGTIRMPPQKRQLKFWLRKWSKSVRSAPRRRRRRWLGALARQTYSCRSEESILLCVLCSLMPLVDMIYRQIYLISVRIVSKNPCYQFKLALYSRHYSPGTWEMTLLTEDLLEWLLADEKVVLRVKDWPTECCQVSSGWKGLAERLSLAHLVPFMMEDPQKCKLKLVFAAWQQIRPETYTVETLKMILSQEVGRVLLLMPWQSLMFSGIYWHVQVDLSHDGQNKKSRSGTVQVKNPLLLQIILGEVQTEAQSYERLSLLSSSLLSNSVLTVLWIRPPAVKLQLRILGVLGTDLPCEVREHQLLSLLWALQTWPHQAQLASPEVVFIQSNSWHSIR